MSETSAGQEECERAVALLEEEAGRLRRVGGKNALRIMPLPLFAGLPAAQQMLALEAAPRNYRKVSPYLSALPSLPPPPPPIFGLCKSSILIRGGWLIAMQS